MQSEEAKRLEASVEESSDNSWNKMATSAFNKASFESKHISELEQEASLMKKRSGHGKESIYEDMDKKSKSEIYLETDDEFLDNSVQDNPKSATNMIKTKLLRIHRYLYGDKLSPSETLRTLCLASTLFFMIGGYWLLRSLKDPVLTAICGVTAIPKAKILSVFVVLFVVSIYNRLLDDPKLKKHQLFYVFGMFYFGLFSIISGLLLHPTIGLANETPSYGRILGWISYCSIESFGSVMVSLFWSFVNSNFNLETAKASYGLLVATAQVGSILGPTIVNVYAETLGVAKIYFLGAIAMLLLQCSMYIYMTVYGTEESRATATPVKKKKNSGVLEGLHLFVKYNYVKGIFAISCLFMIEVTIVDYTMKVLAKDHFSGLHPCQAGNPCWSNDPDEMGMSKEATAAFTTFMGLFGQATNTLSFMLSFLGTSAIIRYLGLRLALLLFPSLCLIVIIIVRINPTLYVVFAAMMILKANSYALNNPTKEMLYQPTSSAVKYKAKSWIDIFGARGSKAMGSLVTNAFSDSAANLVQNGSLVGICVASFLIWNARFMGSKVDEYIESGYIVGGEDAQLVANDDLELASAQNEAEDTSCALYDDVEIKENVSDHDNTQDEMPKQKTTMV